MKNLAIMVMIFITGACTATTHRVEIDNALEKVEAAQLNKLVNKELERLREVIKSLENALDYCEDDRA